MSRFASALLCLALGPHATYGQDVSASITGIIKDSSGAVVPGAKVTATNLDTNIGSTTTSGSGGSYVIPLLRPGQYTLTASQAGFQTYAAACIALHRTQKRN